jgi:hypothetical protein
MATLTELLGLKAVEVESGGSTELTLQVAALRSVLQAALERVEVLDQPVDGVRGSRVAAAARFLFQLAPSSDNVGIGERRNHAAREWGVQPETFRRHAQPKVLAIVAAELRVMSGEQVSSGPASAAGQAILSALRSHYGDAARNLMTLVGTVLPQTVHYDDVSIELVLRDHGDDPSLYMMEYRCGFSAALTEYVVAFVQRAALGDRIMATCPAVNDVWVCSDKERLERNALRLRTGQSFVRVLGSFIGGGALTEALVITQLDAAEARSYLQSIPEHERTEVTIFRTPMPKGATERTRIATQYIFEMRKDDHYCYWVAPRPLFLNRLTFDYGGLSRVGNLTTVAVLGMASTEPEEEVGLVTRFDVQNWIVPGQGAILTWSGEK